VVGGVDALLLGNNEAGAAPGPLRQVVLPAFRGQVVVRQVGEVGGKANAVGDRHLPDFQRREQIFELTVHG
jgi:hypothetical protein